MAGRIPQHFIDELIARTDIVEVVGSRVQLKKAGREWKACCPFHSEKTPSFWVQPDKQFYHCFGCGAHGTALGFLMEHDGLSFVDAVEDLAQRAGLEVPREGGAASPADRAQDDLYALLANVAQFYREVLKETERAKDYLKRRGLAGDTAMRFGIGYAPDAWDAVLKKFGATDAGKRALLAAGLIIERSADTSKSQGPGYYDRFRDRIMFPIRDTRGRVIAFGGRIIDQGEPKYLNSPETVLFHKGRELYGLYEARQALRQMPRLLVVEGYMDVVRLSQAGIHYAVATLGTATTPEHLNRIFRVCTEVVFSFDGDRAGRQAAWRALENALPQAKEGRQLKFLFLPEGHDPDTLVGEEGKEAFEARLAGALPLSEYFVHALKAQVEVETVDGRARLAELAKPLVARLPAGVYRELLIDRLAQEVRMPALRLAQLLGVGAGEDGSPGTGGAQRPPPSRGPVRSAVSAGRGNLVRQAITLILHHPAAARGAPDVEALAEVERPGLALLAELLATLREDPQLSTAQLLERWRERPDGAHLAKLAAGESLVTDAAAAARDLTEALTKLLAEFGPGQRVDGLLRKAADQGLSSEEKIELQRLLGARGGKP